jgi:hypothetical protein
MVTTVKLSDNAKRKLDILQAEIFLSSLKNISKQQLLEQIIDLSTEEKKKLIAKLVSEIQYPLNDQEIQSIMKASKDWGVETKEENLDKVLYGE